MDKQIIIALGREFGSGGHEAAEIIAKKYNMPFLDHVLLQNISEEKNIDLGILEKYDEHPRKLILSRTVAGFTNALEEHVARMQFDYIRSLADKGKSFIVVGRCAEHVLKGNPALISVFVSGDKKTKCARIMNKYGLSEDEALHMMKRKDTTRKNYHDYYCDGKWGNSRNYDVCINSSKFGIDGVADLIDYLIKSRTDSSDER